MQIGIYPPEHPQAGQIVRNERDLRLPLVIKFDDNLLVAEQQALILTAHGNSEFAIRAGQTAWHEIARLKVPVDGCLVVRPSFHGDWELVQTFEDETILKARFETRADAVASGQKLAKECSTPLYVKDDDGAIEKIL